MQCCELCTSHRMRKQQLNPNQAVAVVAVVFLSFCHFPPSGSNRFVEEKDCSDGEDVEHQQSLVPDDGK